MDNSIIPAVPDITEKSVTSSHFKPSKMKFYKELDAELRKIPNLKSILLSTDPKKGEARGELSQNNG